MNRNRTAIVAGNWKMNLTLEEATSLASHVQPSSVTGLDVALFPSFLWLLPVRKVTSGAGIILGAQNCWKEEYGAYTGEVSPVMVAELATAVLAGHSERRHILGESNELVGRKVGAAVSCGLRVFLCVGELLEERETGQAKEVVAEQLDAGLESISAEEMTGLVIAYEPVWAIGTGVAATSSDAQEMCEFIRGWLAERYAADVATGTSILYGGSVTSLNALELFQMPDVDGALVGGACLIAVEFNAIIGAAAEALSL